MKISTAGSPSWRTLLEHAISLLEGPGLSGLPFEWSLGGGTTLFLRYGHRESRDIDIFLHDAQLLPRLSPRLNEAAAAVAGDYVEASTFVKLSRPEGEIDFILAPTLADRPHEWVEIDGRRIRLDSAVEVVLKKAFYRAVDLRARDVFDLAVVLGREPEAMARNAGVVVGKRDLLLRRLDILTPIYEAKADREIAVLPGWEEACRAAPGVVRRFVEDLQKRD